MVAGDDLATFADVMPLLESALDQLGAGQMIHDERISLMDLMSANEV